MVRGSIPRAPTRISVFEYKQINGGSYDVAKRKLKPSGRRRRTRLFTTGRSENGKPVLGNVFIQLESRGVQLETLVQVFDEKGYLIDWIEFYEDAMDANWSHATIIKKIEYALNDVKGPDYTKEILARLIMYFEVRSSIQ